MVSSSRMDMFQPRQKGWYGDSTGTPKQLRRLHAHMHAWTLCTVRVGQFARVRQFAHGSRHGVAWQQLTPHAQCGAERG